MHFLNEKIKQAPEKAGVYKYLNASGQLLYVGKAKNLRKRLLSYMRPDLMIYTQEMIKQATQVEWYVTNNETEALFLEAQWIEELKPLYNIQHRYGRSYTYLTLTQHQFPRLTYKRTWSANSFGPFQSSEQVKQALDGLHYAFKLRSCTDHVFKNRKRPCLEYDLGRCTAPCVNYISENDYKSDVKSLKKMLETGDTAIIDEFETQLQQAIIDEKYELADMLQKRIQAFAVLQDQLPEKIDIEQADLFISTSDDMQQCVYICAVRDYKIRHKIVMFTDLKESLDEFVLRWIVKNKTTNIIYTNLPLESDTIDALSTREISVQELDMSEYFELTTRIQDYSFKLLKEEVKKRKQLNDFAKQLGVASLDKVEVYDNSHMGGKWNLGVKIVWTPAGFQRAQYQKFRYDRETNDDYWMMKEMFKKRFSPENVQQYGLPNLVIIDGGVGQLSVASPYIPVPHFALSKHEDGDKLHAINNQIINNQIIDQNTNNASDTQVTKHEFRIVDIDPAMRLWLMKLRDEAHRYAVSSHSKIKENSLVY